MELAAFLGEDRENWGQITGVINNKDWEKIVLIKSDKTAEMPSSKKIEYVSINCAKPLIEIKDELIKKLKGKFEDFEVHLSLASGTGKEHMALISALLNLPVGIRLIVYTQKGVEVIN